MGKTINNTAIQRLLDMLPVWMFLFLASCNSQPAAPPRDFPLEMKRRILDFQTVATKDPAAAKTQINLLVENLDEEDSENLGEHKATVDQIKTIAKELQTMYGGTTNPSQTGPKIKAMAELANKLPGEVQLSDGASSKQPRDY